MRWLALPGLLWLLLFALVPVLLLVPVSFWTTSLFGLEPSWDGTAWRRLLETPLYAALLWKTFRISVVTTALTLLAAFPLALFLSRQTGRRRGVLLMLLFLPFWVGYVVRTFAWLPILGRNGALNLLLQRLGVIGAPLDWLLYTEGTVYLGLVYVYLLFMVLPIFLSLDKIDPAVIEAARDLRAGPAQVLWRILLPLSLPGILSGSVMVFLMCFGAYVTPALLGGPSGMMFSNAIASQFLAANDWPFGAALSLLMMALVLGMLMLAGKWVGLREVFLSGPRAE